MSTFEEDFGKILKDQENYDGEDAVVLEEPLSGEELKDFEEKTEDINIDINNIFSNVNDIDGNLNYFFPDESEAKTALLKILQEIRDKTDELSCRLIELISTKSK